MIQFKHVGADPGILGGKLILKGTRISVELIMEWVASGLRLTRLWPNIST